MSIHEYYEAVNISKDDPPFYALIMAAMIRADSANLEILKLVFPKTYEEVQARYNSPGGHLPDDETNPAR